MTQVGYKVRKLVLKVGRWYLERQARNRLQANPGLWSMLQSYHERTQSTGCQYIDYAALYDHVRREKPREILECGTGVSTALMAYALMENASEGGEAGRITSMEDIEFWYEMASKLVPEELAEYIDLCLSPRVEDGYLIYRGVRYRDVPERRYDFVFVDGPSTLAPSDGTRSTNFDYIHVVRHSDHPIYGIIDGRLTTCYVHQHVFGEKFRYDPYRNLSFIGPCSRADLRTLTRSSSIALAHSKRVLRKTRFHMQTEPPEPLAPSE